MFRQEFMGAMQSGKPFRRDLDFGAEYSLLLGDSDNGEESNRLKTPQGVPQMLNQGIVRMLHPSTPPLPPPPPHTPTPLPPPPPPLFNMANAMKITIFKGPGTEVL